MLVLLDCAFILLRLFGWGSQPRGAARSVELAAYAGFPGNVIAKAVPAERPALVVGVRYCKIAIYRRGGLSAGRRTDIQLFKGSASLAFARGVRPAGGGRWLSDWQPPDCNALPGKALAPGKIRRDVET